MQIQLLPISKIEPNKGQIEGLPKNPRFIRDVRFDKLKHSIQDAPEMLEMRSLIVIKHNKKYIAICGNMRLRACLDLGFKELPCYVLPADTPVEKLREYTIKDNVGFGQNDWDTLANEWDEVELEDWGLELEDWGLAGVDDEEDEQEQNGAHKEVSSLADRFIIPPFTIIDTRNGLWQSRKRMWRGMIGDMGSTREDTGWEESLPMKYNQLYIRTTEQRKKLGIGFKEYIEKYVSEEELEKEKEKAFGKNTSLFDPVLAEIACRWFMPKQGGSIFDPFAGDTQKGFVFGKCGFSFTGIELRQEQVDVNRIVLERFPDIPVKYICDDGRNVQKHIGEKSQDMLFSCPPYFDLEVYSDNPNDASNQKSYKDFLAILRKAFECSISCLKDDRFAVIVVGDIRNKKTMGYYDFVGDVKRIFMENGLLLYNELILVEIVGSAAIRAAGFMKTRKIVKVHQNVLVFYKGSYANIKKNFDNHIYTNKELDAFAANFIDESGGST